MVQKMKEYLKDYNPEDSEILKYDLEINGNDLPNIYGEVQKYAPYGEGNPAPVFLVNATLTPRGSEYYRFLGNDQSHLKLMSKNFSAIAFGLAQKFQDIGCPYQIRMIGTLGESSFRFTRELQVEAQDIEAQPEKEKPIIFQHLSKIEKI
jgi:single-stranded-DNA-specific exonuclease